MATLDQSSSSASASSLRSVRGLDDEIPVQVKADNRGQVRGVRAEREKGRVVRQEYGLPR
jgi:hypothetical protein